MANKCKYTVGVQTGAVKLLSLLTAPQPCAAGPLSPAEARAAAPAPPTAAGAFPGATHQRQPGGGGGAEGAPPAAAARPAPEEAPT